MGFNKFHDIVGDHLPGILHVPAAGAADTTAVTGIWRAPYKCKITSFKFVSSAAVSGANTNTRSFNVQKATQGGAPSEVAHIDLVSGTNLVAGLNAIALNSGTSVSMNEGDLILFQSEKTGNGLATPAGQLVINIQGA